MERTIYVRFAGKAELLKRVGDTLPVRLADREWVDVVMNVPTLEERLTADADGTSELMCRIAPVLAVAIQAEGDEPTIAAAAQAAREDTLRQSAPSGRSCTPTA